MLEPTTKRTKEKMMLPARAQPLGQLTQSNHPTLKSPNNKMRVPMGVEHICLSMLGSKSTSKSHKRKTKTTVEIELVTEKTEKMGLGPFKSAQHLLNCLLE